MQQCHQQQSHQGAGGSIVLVSAALASHGIPNYEAMSAAKAAVEGQETLLPVLLLLLVVVVSHGWLPGVLP